MNRFCFWHRRYLCGSFFFFSKDFVHDRVEDPPEFEPKTGIERVYKAFSDPEPGRPSKELTSVYQFMGASFIVGFMVGGIKQGNKDHGKFMIANQHTKFISPFEAKRKLQDTVVLGFLRGGVFWGIKAALFCGIYSFCVVAIPIYRNTQEGILEYFIGGALAGGFSRLYLGVKAAFAGATIAGACASVIGIMALLSSTSMTEVRDMQYTWYEMRKRREEKSIANIAKNPFGGQELPNILGMRELRMEKSDTLGYSEDETVFVVMPSPDDVSESVEPAVETAETENKKNNVQHNISVVAVVPQNTSTTK